jgi:hypothetical protein
MLCIKCGLPFYKDERVTLLCRGLGEELPNLTPLAVDGNEAVCEADSVRMERALWFDLVHEDCP